MTIMGLDISSYQENIPYGQVIDWKKLKADPLNFRFIWIKSGEGVDSTSYHEDASRQVAGAKSVNFEAINLYHYYLYQYMNTAGNWVVIPYVNQGDAFYQAYINLDLDIKHPMTDLEDPLINQFLQWSDTVTINAAIAFARRLNKHLKDFHFYLEELFNVKPDIYTGKWWLDKFVPLLIGNGYAGEVLWMKEFNFILADYDGTLNIPDYTGPTIAWQKDSTPNPPVQGIPTGHLVPGDALDIDQWMLSDEEFTEWSGGEIMTTAAWDQQVKQADRAWGWTWRPNQALAKGFSPADTWVDFIELPMATTAWMGSPGSEHMATKKEETFAGRLAMVQDSKMPVIGLATLDASIGPLEQHPMANFENKTIAENFILKFLLDAWIEESAWTYPQLFAKQVHFRNIVQLNVQMTETHNFPWGSTTPLGESWQILIFNYYMNHLRTLQLNGQIPSIPIAFKTTSAWLNMYPGVANLITQRADWLWMAMIKDLNPSTALFLDFDDVFSYVIPESFLFPTILKGYEKRILSHQFGSKQRVVSILDTAGTANPPIEVFKYYTDWEAAYKSLNFDSGIDVPPAPGIDYTVLDNSLLVIEAELEKIRTWRNAQ